MLGLARMAWRLAWFRTYGEPCGQFRGPWPAMSRELQFMSYASPEYYAICDRIARGEKP